VVGKDNGFVELVFGRPPPVWREPVGRAAVKGTPGAVGQRSETCHVPGAKPAGIIDDGDVVVSHGSACPTGQRTWRVRENTRRGRRLDAVTPSSLEAARGREPWCEDFGETRRPSNRVRSAAQRISKISCVASPGRWW